MQDHLKQLSDHLKQFKKRASDSINRDDLEKLRVEFIGRKGLIASLFKQIGSLPPEIKGRFGQELNAFKQYAQERIDSISRELDSDSGTTDIDVTLPARLPLLGTLHPLTLMEREIKSIFSKMGFTIERGPEVEDTWHLFDALNTPEWHPSRDPSDTFYLEDGSVLRTETSPVQIRVMQERKPPIRIVAPGRVFRNDKPDATHSPFFSQLEGLYVDKGVTFSDLKGTVLEFYKHIFGKSVKTRFRPHFFPFTEPSAEVDVSCPFCNGKGCRICKRTGWIEMGGSGMVDPNVLNIVNIDPEIYTGWAFGLGIERLALLLYGIDDIRLFFENDIRFLMQFGGRR
ncbi:MAG: phenylalanine--tRNA ligase subunit alpha [Candidatus Electryonea clarkiae]|nr:phenylalanine--tRNA ligase subunit alpha [Candidatus Electryonea clarkiae]MDP8287170.1 phenylalanine--tRNA ligase subunit alpha [Candidatus Electryonea clarkiae]